MQRRNETKNKEETISQLREKRLRRGKIFIAIIKFFILIFILVGIPAYILIFQRDFFAEMRSLKDVLHFLSRYKREGILVYIIVQTIQIIICIIPGQAFQFAAGSLYGVFPGILLSIIGASVGTVSAYALSGFLGRDALHLFFKKEKLQHYVERLNTKKAYLIVFIIYLIPGLPKDLVCYAAGISNMRFKPFFIISLLGRTPAMSGSVLIGYFYYTGRYTAMWIMAGVAILITILCIVFRKKIVRLIGEICDE